jgi:MEDS: MEthanogen/methylotroph, DcmR Sensory domain
MACSAGFGVDGVTLEPGDHACGLYFGWLDPDRLVAPFFRAGLQAGDRCVIVTDRTDPSPLVGQLGSEAETTAWLASGQLRLVTADDRPPAPPQGLSDEDMLMVLQQAASGGEIAPSGSELVRIGGEVSWWTPLASPSSIAAYESELNRHIGDDKVVLCLYDLSRFSADAVIDAVITHPLVLVGDRLVDNPWYLSPDEFRAYRDGIDAGPPRPSVEDINGLVTGGPATDPRLR